MKARLPESFAIPPKLYKKSEAVVRLESETGES